MKPIRIAVLLLSLLLCLSGCMQDRSRAYEKAVGLFADGEYAEAAQAFERLPGYAQADTYAAYARGLVLYDQGQYVQAEPYFEKTQDFMYGQERYRYCRAWRLMGEGAFGEACDGFRALGEFEDASISAILSGSSS